MVRLVGWAVEAAKGVGEFFAAAVAETVVWMTVVAIVEVETKSSS